MRKARSLAEIKEYLLCPMLFYWNRVVCQTEELPISTLDLPKLAISQALPIYYDGENSHYALTQWVDFVWKTWLDQVGVGQDENIIGLRSFHNVRYNKILRPFLTGDVRGPGGKKYVEPRASKYYKDQYAQLALADLEDNLSEKIPQALNVGEPEIAYLKLGKYSIAQAYSDSLVMADRFSAPVPESVWGANAPVQVVLNGHTALDAVADLIVIGRGKAQVYFLDAHPMFYFDRSRVWRRPDLIAAGFFTALPEEDPFPPVETIYYLHLFTGEVMRRKTTNGSRLSNVLMMANRGISANIFLPAFLSEDHAKCRGCVMRDKCYDREDILESAFPGTYHIAQALETAAANPEALKTAHQLAARLTKLDLDEVSGDQEKIAEV
jgi:hypothetical protein